MLAQIIITVFCFAVIAPPQNHPAPDVDRLLSELSSDNLSVRVKAVEELGSEPDALKQPIVQRALIELVDRENKKPETVPEEANGSDGDRDAYWDGYVQYLSDLDDLANPFIDWDSSVEACIVVHESCNPWSRLAQVIATHARTAMPCVLKLANSEEMIQRDKVFYILVEALANNQLDSGEEQKAREALHNFLHDKHTGIRLITVSAIKERGDASMLPELADIAQTDPDQKPHGVRALAADAIAAIKSRQTSTK